MSKSSRRFFHATRAYCNGKEGRFCLIFKQFLRDSNMFLLQNEKVKYYSLFCLRQKITDIATCSRIALYVEVCEGLRSKMTLKRFLLEILFNAETYSTMTLLSYTKGSSSTALAFTLAVAVKFTYHVTVTLYARSVYICSCYTYVMDSVALPSPCSSRATTAAESPESISRQDGSEFSFLYPPEVGPSVEVPADHEESRKGRKRTTYPDSWKHKHVKKPWLRKNAPHPDICSLTVCCRKQCLTLFAKDHLAKIRGEFQDLYYEQQNIYLNGLLCQHETKKTASENLIQRLHLMESD